MDKTIVDTVNEYKKIAQMLELTNTEAVIDGFGPDFIEGALLRLFYIKSLELKLDASQAGLNEESDMDTFDAVREAEQAIEKVSEMTFEQIESYAVGDKKFEVLVDNTSVNLDTDDTQDLLRQLYKCEGIIQMAHRTAQRHNIYGSTSASWEHLEGLDTEAGKSSEQMIFEDLGIDMHELLDVREKLVNKLEGIVTR